jgi:hypothetical protein
MSLAVSLVKYGAGRLEFKLQSLCHIPRVVSCPSRWWRLIYTLAKNGLLGGAYMLLCV